MFHSRFLNFFFHLGDALRTGELQSKVIICGTRVPELLLLDVADGKLIIGAAVTMTTLEIYLEKLCKTSSGTCITLENLGNHILMINILKVKEDLGEMSGTILLLPIFVLQTLQM
jgi:hypothetical protein